MIRAAVVIAVLAGCATSGPFRLTGSDNEPGALAAALGAREPVSGDRINTSGAPIAIIASGTELALVDLSTGETRWKVPAQVSSRVAIGGGLAVAEEGDELVARNLGTGTIRWRARGAGELLGVAADRRDVYATWKSKRRWVVKALSGRSGSVRWEAESSGRVGAPAAGRGLVLVPFLSQWLALLDARSGELITRVRGIDEEIAFAVTDARRAYFGSRRGVFLLDERAASGRREQGTYGTVVRPEVFADLGFAADGYDPGQAGHNARERRRIVWRASDHGLTLGFDHGAVVLHWYRYLLSIGASDGKLRWAYVHPRIDLVKAAHLGNAIAAVAVDGTIVALDPKSGAPLGQPIETGLAGAVGASFDADGWSPGAAREAPPLAATLGMIAGDRDARFASIKSYAVDALAKVAEPRATVELVELATGGGALAEAAARALVARNDPAAVPALVSRLAPQYDHVAGTRPGCVRPCALALAGLPAKTIAPRHRRPMVRSLLAHFESPATDPAALEAVAAALARHDGDAAGPSFRQFLTLYRADPEIATAPLVRTLAGAIAASGKRGIAALEPIASGKRTDGQVAAEISAAIAAVRTKK